VRRRLLPLATLVPLAALLLAGCATKRLYDGPRRADDEVARIDGSPAFNAGLPIAALIRKVDSSPISAGYSHVSVPPGPHTLLVDCLVYEAHTTTRFDLDIDAESGSHYRLVPVSAPGNQRCDSVRVEVR
jgi:hypothetical protein